MAEENNDQCVGITADGRQCQKRKCAEVGDGTRCRTHFKVVQRNGPHKTELDEINAKHKFIKTQRINAFYMEHRIPLNEEAQFQLEGIKQTLKDALREELDAARERHAAERLRLGHDPDAEANRRREADRLQRERVREERREEFHRHMALIRQRPAIEVAREAMERYGGAADPRPLAQFTSDPQNVHTTQMVKQTKEIVEKVRQIPVPPEYQWNLNITSKTAGEIIAECKLSIHASCQMLTQYSHKTAIYDIEDGIYGKVLDSVWQFIKNSPDKEDLCRILKQEMEDNIGMCAQGNLTRLCNILAGYLDGVAPPESVADKMGRLLPPLMEVEDPLERIYNAFKIMKDNHVPFAEWDSWVGPFIDDEVEDTVDWKSMRDGIHAGEV
jgi:hypothetical protein